VDFAAGLFQSPFYDDVKKIMNEDAMLSELTESPFVDKKLMCQAINEMRKIFPLVKLYWGVVPTYPSGMWTYGIASMKDDPAVPVRSVKDTQWYTNEIHKNSFVLPPFLKKMIN
ncbi:MAG: spermidine synthase, partial [Synergistaceae bacterium]|nr:spermidine synthase [Synergistaceae bacterium]